MKTSLSIKEPHSGHFCILIVNLCFCLWGVLVQVFSPTQQTLWTVEMCRQLLLLTRSVWPVRELRHVHGTFCHFIWLIHVTRDKVIPLFFKSTSSVASCDIQICVVDQQKTVSKMLILKWMEYKLLQNWAMFIQKHVWFWQYRIWMIASYKQSEASRSSCRCCHAMINILALEANVK